MKYLKREPFTANPGDPAAYREGWERTFGDQIDIRAAADRLVEYLAMCGSASERNLSMDRGDEDHYKPLYRTITLFLAPTLPYLDEVLGGQKPTKEQAEQIMCLAHPYFAKALEEERETFDRLWENHWEVWEDD
jgi:hypothetical protein